MGADRFSVCIQEPNPKRAFARARAWAEQHAQESHAATLEIEAITRRAGGEPLVTVHREVTKTVATVTVTITTAWEAARTTDAWLFFGYASS